MSSKTCWCVSFILAIPLGNLIAADPARIDFNRDIRPILADRCFHCHGPDEETREGELRFDMVDAEQGPFGARDGFPVITPNDLQQSAIWHRITTMDPDEQMPPPKSGKELLSKEQIAIIKKWIMQGARYEAFWAFVPPREQHLPAIDREGWAVARIDRFVSARLAEEGQQPQPAATRRQLIRRVKFDLVGLPPTQSEISQFLDDTAANAYERLVDRLLASPQYGEHMTKYWLDLVRFADTNGIHHDHYREMTPYRDWVIRAFNENLSFDDFITSQLAGDLFDEPTQDQLIASGFNRLHLVIDKGTALPAESFARNVIDRTTAFGTALMGLTVQCAVCHDHKYDPITQRDFYQLFAFFNNIDSGPETPGRAIHEPALRMPSASQREQLALIQAEIAKTSEEIKASKSRLELLRSDPSPTVDRDKEEAEAEARADLQQHEEQLAQHTIAKNELELQIPVTLVMRERDEVRPTFVMVRGAYDQPGEGVERGTPSFLPPLDIAEGVATRRDLANWLTSDNHPLTARVAVNRFWQQLFGVGIVKTSEDFGTQGEWPSHPELLDDLAINFIESGWDVKRLVRSIVLSQTYRQSSQTHPEAFLADPENRLLARGSRFRLDSEAIRDQIMAASGFLDYSMYGQSVKPPQPPDLWKNVSMVSSSTYSFEPDQGAKIHRRSLYTFWKRALPPPQMTVFDAPTRESCIARRERTNTPLQALVLMNEAEYFKAARSLATRLVADRAMGEVERLSWAYESITSRGPDSVELNSMQLALQQTREIYQQDVASALAMTSDLSIASDEERIDVAAYTMLVNALFNLDVTKTRE